MPLCWYNMKNLLVKRISLIITFSIFVLPWLNCSETLKSNDYIFITGQFYCQEEDQVIFNINIINCPSHPELYINNEKPALDFYNGSFRTFGFLPASILAEDTAKILVNFVYSNGEKGSAMADVAIPSECVFNSDEDSAYDTLALNNDFYIDWTSANGCNKYKISLLLFYTYDSRPNGPTDTYSMSIDSVIADTYFFVPSDFILPDSLEINYLRGGFCTFEVEPYSRLLDSGEPSNVYGDGLGFILSWSRTIEIDYEYIVIND